MAGDQVTALWPAGDEAVAAAAARRPDSPFLTPEYARARADLGSSPIVLGRRGGEVVVGFVSGRWFRRALEIPSAPGGLDAAFWQGVVRACRPHRIWILKINTFASPAQEPPPLGAVPLRRRIEHVVRLDVPLTLSTNHKRSVSKAAKAGVELTQHAGEDAAVRHAALQAASFARRAERGEHVPGHTDDRECRALLRAGAGTIYRVERAGAVLSSILVLRSAASGYYHSAGTSPEGMELGVSPWLIVEVMRRLGEAGCTSFNLGGATDDNPGLRRFKEGFGAVAVPLYAGRWNIAPGLLRILGR